MAAPFRALASPLADLVKPMPYPQIYPPEDPNYHPAAVGHTMFVDQVDRQVAETIIEYLQDSDAVVRVAQLRVLGGAMARVPAQATAFAHRASRIMVNLAAFYHGPADRLVRQGWVGEFATALQQRDTGAYVGFLGDEGRGRVRARPTPGRPGTGWPRSSAPTTPPTCSGSTRTFRERAATPRQRAGPVDRLHAWMVGPVRGDWDPASGAGGARTRPTTPGVRPHPPPRDPLPMQGGTTFRFVTDGIGAALEQTRTAAGAGDAAIAGGAATVNQYLVAGLVDELRTHIAPHRHRPGHPGADERLFDGVPPLHLEVLGVRAAPLATYISYRVLH